MNRTMISLKYTINVTIIVLIFLTMSCAIGSDNENGKTTREKLQDHYTNCMADMASKFKIIEKDEETGYYKKENLNLSSMVKYAVKNLKRDDATSNSYAALYYLSFWDLYRSNPGNIQIPKEYCYQEVLRLADYDYFKIDANLRAKCYSELKSFPTDLPLNVLDYALFEVVLKDFDGQQFGTSYINHIVENVNIQSGFLAEPEDYCLFVSCHYFSLQTMYFGLSKTNPGYIEQLIS